MSDSLGVGVLGSAYIAAKVVRGIKLSGSAKVLAVGSRTLSKAQAFVKDNGLEGQATPYGSYEEVLDDPRVQAVYIPLPSAMHVQWVKEAAKRGKHIVCEKPISMTLEDALELESLVHEFNVVWMDGTMWWHHPRTRHMEKAVFEQKAIGEVVRATSTFCLPLEAFGTENVRFNKDLDGLGMLGDLGWYAVGAVLWAMQWEVPAWIHTHAGAKHTEDGVPLKIGATIGWKDGRVADVYCAAAGCLTFDLHVQGSAGRLSLEDIVIPEEEHKAFYTLTKKPAFKKLDLGVSLSREVVEVRTPKPQEAVMWDEFAALVRKAVSGKAGGTPPDHSWLNRGVLVQRCLCAIVESHAKGEAVQLLPEGPVISHD